MHWKQRRVLEAGSWVEVLAHFERRPATWLRPFLQLAVRPEAPPTQWYRLSPADAAHVARLVWRPHGPESLFVRFTGTVRLEPVADGAAITLEGWVDGGDEDRNARALGALVDLLAGALAHVSDPDT